MTKQIEKPVMSIKLETKHFDALRAGNVIDFDREWLPFKIRLENWGDL